MFNTFRIARHPFFIITLATIMFGFIYTGVALTGLLLLVWFGMSLLHQIKTGYWHRYPLSILMLAYLAWLGIVAWTSTAPNITLLYVWILAGLPISYSAWQATPNANKIWSALRPILLSTGLFLATWGLWQVLFHEGAGQAVGPLVDKNAYAALINLFWFPTTFYFAFTANNTSRRLPVFLTGVSVFTLGMALFATESRGGIGTWGLLLPTLLWAIYRYTSSKKIIFTIIIISVMSYTASLGLLGMNIGGRTYNLAEDSSTSARLLLWKSSIQMTLDHPIFGTGWGTFVAHYPAYRSPLDTITGGYFAHNDYLQLATEGGVLAMLLQLSVMLGLLLQLKRSLKHSADATGLESVALLLGALALFIHASLNFIFYFAFMNILAGLFLARAAQLVETPECIKLPDFKQISTPIRAMLFGFIFLLFATPLLLHLTAQTCLTGSQPGLNALKIIDPSITNYDVAKLITAIRPQEGLAQVTMLNYAVQSLKDSGGITLANGNFQSELMHEVLTRYDFVRVNTANSPEIGAAEANTLIKYHGMLAPNVAYAKAHEILNGNLKTDPYHADSMIALARLQVAEGHQADAINTLHWAENRVLIRLDQQLVAVEILRQIAAPKVITELNDIEKQLRNLRSKSETGKLLILPAHSSEDIDVKLNAIAAQLQPAH